MTSRDFCYWLQGYFEISNTVNAATLSQVQVGTIQRHLAMVFAHEIDPSAGPPAHQNVLDEIHNAAAAQPNNPPKIGGTGPGGTVYRC